MSARELAKQLADAQGCALALLDVREPWEVELAKIPGSLTIPMRSIPRRIDELPNAPIVVICHHGVRSAQTARFLLEAGFEQVYNLKGGIEAWATEIDPQMAHY